MTAALEQDKFFTQAIRVNVDTQLNQPLPMTAPGDTGVMWPWVLEIFGECPGGCDHARLARL